MQLKEFYDYKNKLMEDILTSEKIIALLTEYNEDGTPKYTVDNAIELAYEQVFPAEFIAETLYDGRTFIMFDVDVSSVPSKTYYSPTIYVWVMAHRSRLRLPDGGGVRTDAICAEIANEINGSKEYGLGELQLNSIKRFAPVTDYNGKLMVFDAKDFNRIHNPNTFIPSNRKMY